MGEGWDHEVDLLVAGSGAGGLAAALAGGHAGLDTLVIEKASVYGGSTALSGGGIWIPNNPELRRRGRGDDPADVLAYLHAIVGDRVPAARIETFARAGAEAMEFLEASSPHLRFSWCKGYADYHPEAPGGRPLGRSIEALPFDMRRLGPEEPRLRRGLRTPGGAWMTASDFHDLTMMRRTWTGRRALLRMAGRVLTNLVRRRHMVTLGGALIGRMRLAVSDAGIPLWLDSPLRELVTDADGRVTGAVVEHDGREWRVGARHGVVIASGGFDHNQALRDQYLPPGGTADHSAGSPENTGDGISAAVDSGAAVDLMDDAWWMPSVELPNGSVFTLVSERCIPRSLIVDQRGERFTNESSPYVNFVHDQLAGEHEPIWFVMDAVAKKRYQFAGTLPGQKFPGRWYKSGLVRQADDLAALAAAMDMPAGALAGTVQRFNDFARAGRDADFSRGDSAYDRYYGDPTLANPCLDVMDTGPYYAIRVVAGDLGTKGGVVCDEHGRALRPDGSVIPGLYATGNASASVMGNEYAGAGATIGPAIAYGYVAARHAAHERSPAAEPSPS